MDKAIGIELSNTIYHDIIDPFLPLAPSFKEIIDDIYIFTSIDEANYVKEQLTDYNVIEAIHKLYYLKTPTLLHDFNDYGFPASSGFYLFEEMTTRFSIVNGLLKDKEMALLQFDEHFIACDQDKYYIAQHYQELIENIAKAYKITIRFFELDK